MVFLNHLLMRNLFLLLFGCLMACSSPRATITAEANHSDRGATDELRRLMTGSFDSSEQAASDSSYYDISLKMIPIWTDRPGDFLYVEQAVRSMADRPYRQRVYELRHLRDNEYASVVYALENEEDAVGKWAEPSWFDQFDPSILREREGCTVFLTRVNADHYMGATRENNCLSSLRGAQYATSQVVVKAGEIASWDQGFDAEGQQVWGATEGGYVFKRN